MKRMTIILAGLLILGMTSGLAFAEPSGDDSIATLANDAGLSIEGLRRDQALFYDLPQAGVDSSPEDDGDTKGILACHFTNGCGYTVNPQVMIDLQYSIVSSENSETTFARNDSLADRLAPNVMFGLHYNF